MPEAKLKEPTPSKYKQFSGSINRSLEPKVIINFYSKGSSVSNSTRICKEGKNTDVIVYVPIVTSVYWSKT